MNMHNDRPTFRARSLIIALAVLAIVLALGFVVGPDQVRPISQPPDPWEAMKQSTSLTSAAQPNEASSGKTVATISETVPNSCPVADTSKLPGTVQEAAKEFNDEVSSLSARLVSLSRKSTQLSYSEAVEEHREIWKAVADSYKAFLEKAEPFAPDVNTHRLLNSEIDMRGIQEIRDQTMLAIAVSHEDWMAAADACRNLGGSDFSNDDQWWDREVYYLRKAGWSGRRTLLLENVMHYWPSL